jgi:hypothetical protein
VGLNPFTVELVKGCLAVFPDFQTQNHNLGYILEALGILKVDILRPSGIIYGHLVNFKAIW